MSNLRGSVAIVAPRSSSEVCSNSKRLSRHSNCRAGFERNCVARKNADRSSWICRSPSLICARVNSRQARSKTQLLRRNILHFSLGHVVHWPDNLFLSSQEISISSPMLYPAAGGCHGFLDRCESNRQSPEITRACISRFGDTSSSYAPISFPGNPCRPVNVVQPKVPERTDTPIFNPEWACPAVWLIREHPAMTRQLCISTGLGKADIEMRQNMRLPMAYFHCNRMKR